MVEFEAVEKDYGDLKALDGVSFSVPVGGIVGLLGPNGAGKTTTMRIMTGFLEPTAGSVRISGEEFSPDSVELKRRIGYLPESAPVYGDMLAWDYLTYEARLHGLDATTRVPEVIREVGLSSHGHKPIRELYKGYRQRVGSPARSETLHALRATAALPERSVQRVRRTLPCTDVVPQWPTIRSPVC
jgi:ABC-2 type transport system ATP-binding protein